jgi:anti-sigma regulatory factor (Ser/Thr protein kinase)
LGDAEAIPVLDDASLTLVRQRVRAVGAEVGLETDVFETMATTATELARNQLLHARGGRFAAREISRGGVRGVELVAADRGGGLAKPGQALNGVVRPGNGLGKGLAAVREAADEVDFDIRFGQGSCIWARRFVGPPPYRSEAAILGRPCVGETESGDDGGFVRGDDALTLGVIDGLGHGILARDVAATASSCFRRRADDEPAAILAAVDEALRGTRGVVMATARLDRGLRQIAHAALGDVRTHIYRPRECRCLPAHAGVLGEKRARAGGWKEEREELREHDVVVMFTDGLTTRVDISEELALLRRHPVVIAEYLLEHFGRDNDDVLILVAR